MSIFTRFGLSVVCGVLASLSFCGVAAAQFGPIIELPPAGTLAGLAKRALKGVEIVTVNTPAERDAVSAAGGLSADGCTHGSRDLLRPTCMEPDARGERAVRDLEQLQQRCRARS